MTTNPRNIEWPQDTTGFLYALKNAGVKAVERQLGNPEKHEALMGTLRVLAKHAKARFELQAENRAARIAEAAAQSDPQAELDLAEGKTTTEGPEPVPAPADEAGDPVEPDLTAAPDGPQIEPAFEVKPVEEQPATEVAAQ